MNLTLEISARNSHALVKSSNSFNINGIPMLSLGKGTEQNRFENVSKYSSETIYSDSSFTTRYTYTIYKGTYKKTPSEDKTRYAAAFLTFDGRLEITSLKNLDYTSVSKARLKVTNTETGGSNSFIANYMGDSNTQYFLLLQQEQGKDRFYNYDFTTQSSTAQNPINYVYVLFLAYEMVNSLQVVDFKGKINNNQVKIGQPTLSGSETLDPTRQITASSYSFSTKGLTKTRDSYISQNQNINQIKNYFSSRLLTINAPTEIKTITKSLLWDSSFVSSYEYNLCGKPTIEYTTYDDTTYTYELRRNSQTFKAYVGQPFPSEFYNAFELVEHRHNEYINQEDRIYYDKLSTTYISTSYSRPSYNSTAVIINYTASQPSGISPLTYTFKSGELVQISSENNFFSAPLKTTYELNDVYSYQELINQVYDKGTLTYSDGTSINISDYRNDISITISDATLTDNTIITPDTLPTFTCTININSSVFGNFTYTHTAIIGEEELAIVSAELVDYKTHFEYGETIIFGNNAKIYLKNADGDIVRTIQSSEIINSISILDEDYNKVINEENSQFLNDTEFELTSTLKDYELTIVQKFKVSYPARAIFNYESVPKTQYWLVENINTFKFDLSKIAVSVEYHDNTSAETEISNVAISSLSTSYNTITNTNSKDYVVKVSFTYKGRYFEDNNLIIKAEKVRPVSIVIDDSGATETATEYWNTGEAFKYPNGYEFALRYNAIKSDQTLTYQQLRYYWNNTQLQVGETILSQYNNVGNANPTSIIIRYYDVSSGTEVEDSFPISWRDNDITSADIQSESPIEITLGNSLNTLRGLFPIRVNYGDGSFIDNYQEFNFVNGSQILKSAPSEIKISILDDGERKEFTLSSNKYTFIKPKISEIVVDTNNLSTTVNNGIDGIDLTGLELSVYYENAEYVAKITTYKFLETSESLSANEFTATNTTLGTSFHYDGSSIASVSLSESEVEKTLPITLSIINEFGVIENDKLTATINIKVIEIVDITGLSIERTFEDYYIGDKFLDDTIETNDNCTQIWVWYKDGSGSQRRLLVNLKDGLKSLNVMPRANTQFYSSERNKTIRVSASTNPSVYVEYSINVEPKYVQSDLTITTDIVAILNNDNYTTPKGKVISGKYLLVNENVTHIANGVRVFNISYDFTNVKVYGYLEDIGDRTKNARVILFEDYIPPIDGQSNITCEFPCFVKGNADKINKCTFGHLFGNNNAKNRLFVSGNPDTPNCDWHSGAINTSKQEGDVANENGDFTYFEDTSYCFYGQTDNKVVGYDIVSNDRLVVLKSKSDKEPTIYYRTSGLVQAVNGSGNNVVGLNNTALYEEQYPLSIGNIGTGALNSRAIINFNGDTLFMSSDKELDGLDITGIIGDSQRYAYSRSKYIDPIFRDMDLSKVWLWTNQKYLFLITENEVFITYFETLNAETKQYEWRRLDLADVQVCIEFNDRIYFGNSTGELFLLKNGEYADKTKFFIRKGMTSLATINETNDTITIDKNIINQLDENKKYTFKLTPDYDGEKNIDYSSLMFYQVANINNIKSGNVDLYVNSEENALEIVGLRNGEFNANAFAEIVNLIDSNINYFLNFADNSNQIETDSGSIFANFYQPYKLVAIESGEGLLYAVYNAETNERLNVSELRRANLVACLDKEYQIVDINKEDSTFKIIDQNEKPVNVVRYGDQDPINTFSGEITHYESVNAYYISAPFTLGDLMYDKTIWAWTLTNDTQLESAVEAYEATNDLDFESMRKVVALNLTQSYNLNKFNFNRVNFGKNVVPYKYTFIRPLLVPFICFGFKNNDNTNAVLCAIQINYSKPNLSFGKGR